MTNETNNQAASTPHQCWSCKKEIAPTDRFCPHCGAKVRGGSVGGSIIKCPTCYKPISSQVEFCPYCGTSIAKASVVTAATGNGSSSTADVSGAKEEPQVQIASPSANVQSLLKSDQGTPWKKIIGGVALLLLGGWILLQLFGSGGSTSNLRVKKTSSSAIVITNIERPPITIQSVFLNGKKVKEAEFGALSDPSRCAVGAIPISSRSIGKRNP
jgi:predicted RNA-binding Zn-ribbon protein involved in translation (DUF1610 family)